MANKKKKQYVIQDTVMVDKIYPIIDAVAKNKTLQVKKCIEKFVQSRQSQLYDYAPIDRIYFRKQDADEFFKALGLTGKEITAIVPELYYYKADELQAAKDEFSLACLMFLRWCLINKPKDTKYIELIYMYLSFSGKYYAACHSAWFRHYLPDRAIMDYVVNYMLSQKFDIIKAGSVWGAIRNLTSTWCDTYGPELASKDVTDERIVYMIHQLHNRIYAFLRNIAKPYYEAYEKKLYLNKDSDNYNQDDYRISNNDSTRISNITENAMNYFTTNRVNYEMCYKCSGTGVDPKAIKAILENIVSANERLSELRMVINVLLVDYVRTHPEEKDITGPGFIAHSIAAKPNTKDKNLLRLKNTVIEWLNTSERYRNTKTEGTRNNYYRTILMYISLVINKVNKEG